MNEITASRTIVKSPPELWAECSDAESLARHLNGSFGEIRITRLEPETAVAWEGEQYSGTVRLEPAGWGTKVVLTASPEGESAAPDPPAPDPMVQDPMAQMAPAPEAPPAEPEPPAPRRGVLARLFGFLGRGAPAPAPSVELAPPAGPEPAAESAASAQPAAPETAGTTPPAPPAPGAQDELAAALDSLGSAHHRPFSRG